jgi:hypothetical protein
MLLFKRFETKWEKSSLFLDSGWIQQLDTHCHQNLSSHKTRNSYNVKFVVLMAVTVKIATFCYLMPCSVVNVYWHFEGAWCFRHGFLYPEDAGDKFLPKFGNFYQTAQYHILEGSSLHNDWYDNHKHHFTLKCPRTEIPICNVSVFCIC